MKFNYFLKFQNILLFLIIILISIGIVSAYAAQAIGTVIEISCEGTSYENVDVKTYVASIEAGEKIAIIRNGKIVARGAVVLSSGGKITVSFFEKGIAKIGDRVFKHSDGNLAIEDSPYPKYHRPNISYVLTPSEYNKINETPKLLIVSYPQMNAFSAYVGGQPVIALTDRMCMALFVYSYYIAIGEIYNPQQGIAGLKYLVVAEALQTNTLPPMPSIPSGNIKQLVERRANELYAGMVYFVVGHEAGHIVLGHLRNAYNCAGMSMNSTNYIDGLKLARLYNQRINEIEADAVATHLTLQQCGATGGQAILYFLILMEAVEKLQGQVPEYLRDHPNWTTRAKFITAIIQNYIKERGR